ncbi:hypothetical protein ACFOD9_08585 [Novosphingobium bradum]|uniref:EF-hand domain-containing protein n=1 Tax=Novosphingobium bradum TaxID=1737444 RepID=A0ABV7ITZ6_9SPHN
MNRTVLGAFGALILVAAGLFWWQGRAAIDPGKLPVLALAGPAGGDLALPSADGRGLSGPALPEASEATREQRRFDRLDRNRDGRISRVEMLTPRAAAFRKLDVDGNNLLTFDEWAVRSSNRFKGADVNGDGQLDRTEFAATKPRPHARPACKCAPGTTKTPAPPRGGAGADDGDEDQAP